MPNPRKPTHLHVVANTAHSSRVKVRDGEPTPAGEDLMVAHPPARLSEPQAVIWRELQNAIHPAVAFSSDTIAFEALVRMIEVTREGNVRPALISQLRAGPASFGMTPADRSRVTSFASTKPGGFAALRAGRATGREPAG